ncbi:hypothetical protein [Pseudomonas sp. B21-048]|uniref:hypothetical protein n=1 Tax=Pseudomonas sp. B21-048 TaxID=2895490 RepID=UPI00215DFFE8|nr:hypothetical protein [Pseudomonas sp. B21-048]UVL00706.1 hypothetical protein LOY56_10260 [Pseudomonas sp. B21-048]
MDRFIFYALMKINPSPFLFVPFFVIDFKNQQWERLEQEILQKPEYWQQRCAVSLGEDRTEQAIKLLKLLLSSSCYIDVKIIATYELDWAEVPIEKIRAFHQRAYRDNTY